MSVIEVDAVVVGGGVMGSAAAWRLAARGVDTVLLERFEPGHVRGASHGASRIFRYAYPDRLYAELAARSLPWWREIEAEAGVSLLTVTGGLDHGATSELEAIAETLAAVGHPGQWLHPDEAAQRWPGLRFDTRVLYQPEGGRLDADAAVAALQQLATAGGAQVRHHARATRVDPAAGTVEAAGDVYRAKHVVIAAGAWTERLLGGRVTLPPLRVTQEQPAHFAPFAGGEWPSFIHHRAEAAAPFQFVYGMRTPGDGVKVGFHHSGPECDPDTRDFAPEAGRQRALADYVREWVPGADADALTPISCTYTTTPGEDFVVDAADGFVVAAGFSGHGFKFAPLVGELVAGLALDRAAPEPRFAFRS